MESHENTRESLNSLGEEGGTWGEVIGNLTHKLIIAAGRSFPCSSIVSVYFFIGKKFGILGHQMHNWE
jgi:hypothetical protein